MSSLYYECGFEFRYFDCHLYKAVYLFHIIGGSGVTGCGRSMGMGYDERVCFSNV